MKAPSSASHITAIMREQSVEDFKEHSQSKLRQGIMFGVGHVIRTVKARSFSGLRRAGASHSKKFWGNDNL